jgi:hypothetical protein
MRTGYFDDTCSLHLCRFTVRNFIHQIPFVPSIFYINRLYHKLVNGPPAPNKRYACDTYGDIVDDRILRDIFSCYGNFIFFDSKAFRAI